jgi:hypothetical protein
VFRMSLLASLLLVGACSDRSERSGYLALPGAADSLNGPVEQEPTLVLRCLDGRVDAYLAMDPSADPGVVSDQIVPVQLDSAPPCSEPFP